MKLFSFQERAKVPVLHRVTIYSKVIKKRLGGFGEIARGFWGKTSGGFLKCLGRFF